jgi:hypothetical protein
MHLWASPCQSFPFSAVPITHKGGRAVHIRKEPQDRKDSALHEDRGDNIMTQR